MRKALWIPVFLGLIVGSVKAQETLSGENDGLQFLIAEKINQDNPILNSDLTTENQAPITSRKIPLTGKEKLRYMLTSTYEVKSIMFSLAGAGIRQARDSVPEWGQGMEGYGKRLASSFGHKIVKRSIQLGLGNLLHEDPRYFFAESSGILRRSLYAASRTFVSNKDGGGIRPGYSKFIATFSGAYISRQWYPERAQTPSEYLTSSGVSMGIDAAKNVFNEFWPDLKRMLRR